MLLKMAARNIMRNKRRSILSGGAILFVVMVFVYLFSLIEGFKQNLVYNVQTYFTGEIRIRHREYDKNEHLNPLYLSILNSEEVLHSISGLDYIDCISPRVRFTTGIYRDNKTFGALGLGVDLEREEDFQNLESILTEGRLPEKGEREILVAEGLAREMGVNLNDKITLFAQTRGRGTNAITLKVVGMAVFPVPELNRSFFIGPMDTIQYFLRMGDSFTEILIKLRPGWSDDEVVARLNEQFGQRDWNEIQAKSWKDIGAQYRLIKITQTMYDFLALFFLLLGSTVITATTIIVIYERMKEIGTIGTLGMTRGQILLLFFLEALLISAVSATLGVGIGIAITIPSSNAGIDFGSTMGDVALEMSTVIYPQLAFRSTFVVFIYAIIVASLSTLIPSWKATRIEPAEVLRH